MPKRVRRGSVPAPCKNGVQNDAFFVFFFVGLVFVQKVSYLCKVKDSLCACVKNFFVSLLIALIIAPSAVAGQSVVYDLSPQASEFSIVRHYVNDVDITYSWYLSDENCFCYVDRQNNIYYKAYVGMNLKVYDFRIFNDVIYFCGEYGNSSAIGWFDIAGLFFNSDYINIVNTPIYESTSDTTGIGGYDVGIRGTRLKVFKQNGDLHLVMVGAGQHLYYDKQYVDTLGRVWASNYSAIIDMWTADHLDWYMRYTMDYYDEMSYDDIAVTSKYVVVTAHSIDTNNNYLSPQILYYSKPVMAGQSFLGYPYANPIYAPGYCSYSNVIHCRMGAPLLVAEMVDDTFATACDAVVLNDIPVTAVTYYEDPVSVPIQRFLYHFNDSYGDFKEIRYNVIDRFLYLFRFHTRLLERIGPPFSYAYRYKGAEVVYCGMSMDVIDKNGMAVITSSDAYTMKKLWWFNANHVNDCVNQESAEISKKQDVRDSYSKRQYWLEKHYQPVSLRCVVSVHEMDIICE